MAQDKENKSEEKYEKIVRRELPEFEEVKCYKNTSGEKTISSAKDDSNDTRTRSRN
jgi:hypothetical protein